MKYIGCKKAKEISLTRDPAQPLATVLVRKSAGDPTPENDDMNVKHLQRVASMSDVTKSYFAGLSEEAVKTFLEKAVEDQDAEAEAAKKASDDAAAKAKAEEEARKTKEGITDEAVKALRDENEVLKKRLDERDRADEIAKTCREERFRGYPGGEEELRKAVTAAFGADEEVRKTLLAQAEQIAKMASMTGQELGTRNERDIARSHPKSAAVIAEATKRAKANGTSKSDELVKMKSEPEWKDAVAAAMAEEPA